MNVSNFEYGLAFISILLIITIITIIYYKKNEDKEDTEDNDSNSNTDSFADSDADSHVYDNSNHKDTYLKANTNIENFDNIENFSNIDNILGNNATISSLINNINDMSKKNTSIKISYSPIQVDRNLQSNIAASLHSSTDNLISKVGNKNKSIADTIDTVTNQIIQKSSL